MGTNERVTTFCDQETEGGGWTTILERDASKTHQDFDRNYTDYENGFGDRNGEFWLGLQTIHQLTTFPCTELRIDMETYDGTQYVAKYSTFIVGSKDSGYLLTLDGFSSTPYTFPDDFSAASNGSKFSTKDNDQEIFESGNCAITFKSGWWYSICFGAKLTGKNFEGSHPYGLGLHWISITGLHDSFKKASMKVRRRLDCN